MDSANRKEVVFIAVKLRPEMQSTCYQVAIGTITV